MRGESHLAMSMLISLPTFVFLLKLDPSVEFLRNISATFAGIILGSLLPDLDAPDSKIMYEWWKPFGLFGKYALNKPLEKLFGDEHRGILHSVFGCLFTSLVFALISFALYPTVFFIWYIWFGIPIGFMLHLAEDSFTISGVRWFFPFGEPIQSTTITGSGREYILHPIMFMVYGSLAALAYFLLPASTIMLLLVIGITFALLVIFRRMNPRIGDIGDRYYSLERLVEFYIEEIGGKRIKPRKPSGLVLKIESEKEHIVQIVKVGGRYPLHWGKKYSAVAASGLEEGNIVEMRTYEGNKEKLVYYIVQDGTFYAFLERVL